MKKVAVVCGGNSGEKVISLKSSAFVIENLDAEKAEQRAGNYKRADLLKMHAYRDAIRRSAGAYVLYPGSEKEHSPFRWFH